MMETCRNEFGSFPVSIYLNLTCALCYTYTFHSADPLYYPLSYNSYGSLVYADHGLGENSTFSETFLPLAADRSAPVYRHAFPVWEIDRDADVWNRCCEAAAACCAKQLTELDGSWDCPSTWDGWQCWTGARRSQKLYGDCPRHISPVELPICFGAAEKECTNDGMWFELKDTNLSKEWTNYTSCLNLQPLHHRFQAQIIVYCISVAFLVPALLIFWKCQHLHVQRNFIHVHFFASLLLYAAVLILFQAIITRGLLDNPDVVLLDLNSLWECRLLYSLAMYLRLCNYCWMFCEGLFLLRHLTHVFMRENHFFLYVLAGWGLPSIPVSVYVGLRSHEDGCWIAPKDSLEWILKGPALLSLALNFVFLCYIICLLVRKLQMRCVGEIEKIRKGCRAILVLMPLFGLHFVITAYRPPDSCAAQWYFYLNSALDGLQGFFVSVTFCYCNSEVIGVFKKLLRLWQNRPGSRPIGRSSSMMSRASNVDSVRSTSSPSKSSKPNRIPLCRYESLMGPPQKFEQKQLLRSTQSSPLNSEETTT